MEVLNVEEPVIAVRVSQYPEDKKNEFLCLGRSNVGKSSFINTIVNRKNIARTSSKPGKTTTLNFYQVNKEFYIVDVPGYGYAATNKKQIEKFGIMIEEYLKTRQYLKHVFLLVTIVATKYDKVNRSLREKQDELIKKTLNPALGDEIINFSSVTKVGKERIYEIIESYFKNDKKDIEK